MKKRISILSILLLLGMTVYAQTDIPQVIPSLQHWNGAKGKLSFLIVVRWIRCLFSFSYLLDVYILILIAQNYDIWK